MHACLHKEVQSVPKQQTQKKPKPSEQCVQTRAFYNRPRCTVLFTVPLIRQRTAHWLPVPKASTACSFPQGAVYSRRELPAASHPLRSPLALPSSRLLPYQQNKKNPGRISFCKGHRTAKERQVGRCRRVEAHRAQGGPGCLYGAVLDSSVDTGHTHCSPGGRGARGARSRIKGAESQMCVWVWRVSYELSGGRGEIQLLSWENAGTLCGARGPLHTR